MNPVAQSSQNDKYSSIEKHAYFKKLNENTQTFLFNTARKYRLSLQEYRLLRDYSVDLDMWREISISDIWTRFANQEIGEPQLARKRIFNKIRDFYNQLEKEPKAYPKSPLKAPPNTRKVVDLETETAVFGLCPVYSDKTVCCNLYTIDAAQGCGFGCSYCSIQSFYSDGKVSVDKKLAEKLNAIDLDPNKTYHIGSGQSSDSLLWGNKNGVLDAQLDFARNNSNIILELKTKSKNIRYFKTADTPHNLVVSWSISTPTIIANEEHLTATFDERIQSARAIADLGIGVAFHFHPMVHYQGWDKDYASVIKTLMENFTPEEIAFISFGTLTFTKPAIRSIREHGHESKILQMPKEDAVGKLSYPWDIKQSMFKLAWDSFSTWQDSVFFYLCMEDESLWTHVFGRCYTDNQEFERAFFSQVSEKLSQLDRQTI